MQLTQKLTVDLHNSTKQCKMLDETISFQNRELVKHIQEKHDCQRRLEDVEAAMNDLNDNYEVIKKEHKALQETNAILDKKVRNLSSENQMFLNHLMELKEKQVEKYNEAAVLYQEVESMRQQMEFANITPDSLKQIKEIMVVAAGGEGEKLKELKAELIKSVKQSALEAAKEASMNRASVAASR